MTFIRKNRALTLTLVASLALPTAAHARGSQTVEGRVLAPFGYNCDFVDAILVTAARLDQVAAFTFTVDRRTWGQRFVLEPTATTGLAPSGPPIADLDISFSGTTFPSFSTFGPGGESGRVPRGATEATVCMMAGSPTNFIYTSPPSNPREPWDLEGEVSRTCSPARALIMWLTGVTLPCP